MRVLATITILSITASVLWGVGKTMLIGRYWESAPLGLTVIVGLIAPSLIALTTINLLKTIWKKP